MPDLRAGSLRPMIIVLLGVLAVALAVVLTIVRSPDEAEEPAVASSPQAPVSPPGEAAPAPAAPGPGKAPEPAPTPSQPSFDIVRINPRGDAVMAGRAAPDTEVVIKDGGKEIGKATADARGEWVFVPSEPLPPGSRELSLEERRPGGESVASESVVVLVVPERPTDAASGELSEPTLAVQVPRDGAAPAKLLQGPPQREGASKALSLDTIEYGENGQITLSGRAEAGSLLQLYLDNRFIGRVEVPQDGGWTASPGTEVSPGLYALRVDQVDAAGKVVARVELPFSRAQEAIGSLKPGSFVVVQPGNSLWRIARRTYGEGLQYMVIYQSNKEQIRDPDLIYPGQVFVLPSAAPSD